VASFSSLRLLLKGWLLSFLGWGLVALVLGADHIAEGFGGWREAGQSALRDWLPWAILTPLFFLLVERLPLDRSNWRRAWPIHLLCALAAVSAIHLWKEWNFRHMPMRMPMMDHHEPPGGWNRDHDFGPPLDWKSGPGEHGPGGPPGPMGGMPMPPHGGLDLFHYAVFELPILLMILSGAHAVLFFRREQQRAVSVARARLDALRTQLQPHFLFNSLNTIAGLVHDEPDKADAMLIALSEMLRHSLATAHHPEVPLAHELKFVEHYLAIMHARFEDKLRYRVHPAAETLAAMLPSFLLQPLVESAVLSGIEPRTQGGALELRAWREGPTLRISIAVEGQGEIAKPAEDNGAVADAHTRLQELFGPAGGVTLRADAPETIDLCLPFHLTNP
jgi:hypothetical protein